MFFVYLLLCSDGATYVGATTDLNQRLRKHNGEIKGGAVATSNKVKKGEIWTRACHVEGFPTWQAALQFEWRWKQISRTFSPSLLPLERRMKALTKLLSLDRSTTKATPFSEWATPPKVNIEVEEANQYYDL